MDQEHLTESEKRSGRRYHRSRAPTSWLRTASLLLFKSLLAISLRAAVRWPMLAWVLDANRGCGSIAWLLLARAAWRRRWDSCRCALGGNETPAEARPAQAARIGSSKHARGGDSGGPSSAHSGAGR